MWPVPPVGLMGEGPLDGGPADALSPGDLGNWLMVEPGLLLPLISVFSPIAREGGTGHRC